jgi:hypothetical protein
MEEGRGTQLKTKSAVPAMCQVTGYQAISINSTSTNSTGNSTSI